MPDDAETQAQQSLRWLAFDRARQAEGIRAAASGVPRLRALLDDMGTVEGDPLTAGLRELTDALLPHLTASRPGAETTMQRLDVGGLNVDEPAAKLSTFPDGSARVLVSDGMVSLLRLFADLTSIWYAQAGGGSGWIKAIKTTIAVSRLDRDERIVPVLTTALRWNVLHRRIWGRSATLAVDPATEAELNLRDLYAHLSLMFVLAHECAHHLLGHDERDVGDPAVELAADELALAATRAYVLATDGPDSFALVGALLAMHAAELVERVLFVRTPRTHPAAASRWRALAGAAADSKAVQRAVIAVSGLAAAVDKAADPGFELPEQWWRRAYEHPRVHCDVHDPAYYEHFWSFDQLSFGGPDRPASFLERARSVRGIDALGAAVTARDHGLGAGLAALGLDASTAAEIADPDLPLSHHSLFEHVRDSPMLQTEPNSTFRQLAALASATLLSGVETGRF